MKKRFNPFHLAYRTAAARRERLAGVFRTATPPGNAH